jgi:hypothetical protein
LNGASPAAPRLRFVDPLRDHLSHGVDIDLAGHAVDSALEAVNHSGRGNDDGPSLDVERLLADRECRPALQHDEGLLVGMSMWLRALPSAATHDEEGHIRSVVAAHEDRGDRVVRDVFDTEDLQAPILTRGTMRSAPFLNGIDDYARFIVCAGLMLRASSRAVRSEGRRGPVRSYLPEERDRSPRHCPRRPQRTARSSASRLR